MDARKRYGERVCDKTSMETVEQYINKQMNSIYLDDECDDDTECNTPEGREETASEGQVQCRPYSDPMETP